MNDQAQIQNFGTKLFEVETIEDVEPIDVGGSGNSNCNCNTNSNSAAGDF